MTSTAAEQGFAYRQDQFQQIVEDTLKLARELGASDSGAEVSEGVGLSVSVRKGELENVERNRDKSLGVSVYLGQRRGNASTSDFSAAALRQTVQAAIDAAAAAELACRCEDAALAVDKRITNSEGAGVSAQQAHFWAGNSRGFRGGYSSSRHYLSVSPIAGKGRDMQRDGWYTSMRDAADLAAPEVVGRYAAERALARLKSRRVPTEQVPVLFESTVAAGLLGAYVQATSGGALYRKTSFLVDSLGKKVLPAHVDIFEQPHELKGKGSAPFDDDGVRTTARQVVAAGVVQGYFLSSYSARKLGMHTTGHAGGSQNLTMSSRRTRKGDTLDAMIAKMGRGLFVTELMGQGVNYVTGDYSRGAAGFWVENGRIAYPVQEVTIAGNLRQMFKDIQAIGADVYTQGSKRIGSVLLGRMKLAGS